MTPEEAAHEFSSSRPGFTLVDFMDVGLPCWRVLARCEVLAKKDLSVIDETVLHALFLGLEDVDQIQFMLGLDEVVLGTTVAAILNNGWAVGSTDDGISLTPEGREQLDSAFEVVSQEIVIPLDYDGLRRTPINNDSLIEQRLGSDHGLRPIPPVPNRKPSVPELRLCKPEIALNLAKRSDGRHRESELLEIRDIDRRDRLYLPATALVFAPNAGGRCEIAFVVDGKESPNHEAAFQNAGLLSSFGLERSLTRLKKGSLELKPPNDLSEPLDLDREAAARGRIRQLETESNSPAAEGLSEAKKELARITPRTVEPSEHRKLLRVAIAVSTERLLIAGGHVSSVAFDIQIQRALRKTLESGTLVHIAFQGGIEGSSKGEETLHSMDREFENLRLREVKKPIADCVLLSDSKFLVEGKYPWLGHIGDPSRQIRHVRSIFRRDKARFDEIWSSADGRKKVKPGKSKRRARKTGRRRKTARD